LPLAPHLDDNGFFTGFGSEELAELLQGGELLSGVGDQDIAGLQARLRGVAAGDDLGDEKTAGRQRCERGCCFGRREQRVADGQQACAAGR
jgi:hypothetical protein